MELARFKQPVAVVIALVCLVLSFWGFGGRGPVLTGSTPFLLQWPFGLAYLGVLLAYCFLFDAKAGLYWVAGSAPVAALLVALKPLMWGGELTAHRLITGTVLLTGVVLGVAVHKSRV